MDKIDKYIAKFATRTEVSNSGRSRYYQVCNKIIRVSDHIGNTSDGCYHIIVKPNGYIIHHPATGTVNIVSYEELKEFIRVFQLFPFIDTTCQVFYPRDVLNDQGILGVDVKYFSKEQLKNVIGLTNKVKKQNKL